MKKSFKRNMSLNLNPIFVQVPWKSWLVMTEATFMKDFMNSPKNKFEDKKQQNFIKEPTLKQPTSLKFKSTPSKCFEKVILGIDWLKTQRWEVFDSKIEKESKNWLSNSFESKSKSTSLKSSMKTSFWKNIWMFWMRTV